MLKRIPLSVPLKEKDIYNLVNVDVSVSGYFLPEIMSMVIIVNRIGDPFLAYAISLNGGAILATKAAPTHHEVLRLIFDDAESRLGTMTE